MHVFTQNKNLSLVITLSLTWPVSATQVTDDGHLVIPLDNAHRKPYEVIILGVLSKYQDTEQYWRIKELCAEGKVIVSVPALHSRKPPLHRTPSRSFAITKTETLILHSYSVPYCHQTSSQRY